MPAHDFRCKEGHTVELIVPTIDAGMKQKCLCGSKIVAFATVHRLKTDTIPGGVMIPHLVNQKGNCYYDSDGQVEKAKQAHGLIQNEAGLDRDIARNAQYKQEAQRGKIRGKLEKMVADIPAGYRIKTV